MSAQKSVEDDQKILDDVHPFLEKVLIETYLKGKGYILDELEHLPKEKMCQLLKEASTYASCKLAEVEARARLMQELYSADLGE